MYLLDRHISTYIMFEGLFFDVFGVVLLSEVGKFMAHPSKCLSVGAPHFLASFLYLLLLTKLGKYLGSNAPYNWYKHLYIFLGQIHLVHLRTTGKLLTTHP